MKNSMHRFELTQYYNGFAIRIAECLFVVAFFLMGCQGCANAAAWKKAKDASFESNGAVVGNVTVQDRNGGWILRSLKLINFDTQKTYPLSNGGIGFFTEVPPGKYALHVGPLWKVEGVGPYGNIRGSQQTEIFLDRTSQSFAVNTGEVVYIGDVHLAIGETVYSSFKDPDTWVSAAVGLSKTKTSIEFSVRDDREAKLAHLKELHPAGDYRFVERLIEFNYSPNPSRAWKRPQFEGLEIAGFAEDVQVFPQDHKIVNRSARFSRSTKTVYWFGVADPIFRQKVEEKKIRFELKTPDQRVAMQQVAAIVNDSGLITLSIPLALLANTAQSKGRWTLIIRSSNSEDVPIQMRFDVF